MSRVLLFIPPYLIPPEYPLCGLGAISESLDNAGIDHEVLDLRLEHDPDQALFDRVTAMKPDWVGITLGTQDYPKNYARLAHIKELCPNTKIVAGGPHISTLREEALAECPAIDYGLILEGERSLVELLQGRDVATIGNLIYREGGQIKLGPHRELELCLDELGWPRYRRFDMPRYHSRVICLVTSRGCPQTCIFCPVRLAIGAKLRLRSAESIVEEVRYWVERDYRLFYIQDDNFTYDADRITRLCKLLRETGLAERARFALPNAVRADKTSREMLRDLRSAGFFQIAFGVESGNDRILENLKKGEDVATIDRAIRESVEEGFDVGLFFLIGSPGETEKDVDDSFHMALKYPVKNALFYNLIPYPKTPLMRWIKENGRFLIEPKEYLNEMPQFAKEPVFETNEFPAEARRRCLVRSEAIMETIRKQAIRRELETRYGLPGKLLAPLLTTDFGLWMINNVPLLRRLRAQRHLKRR